MAELGTLPLSSNMQINKASSITETSDDQALAAAAHNGDETAFEQLVYRHTPNLYRVVRRITNDDLEAEAVLQETFFRFWQALPRYRNERPLFPYLVTIAANIARDHWRREQRLSDDEPDNVEVGLSDESALPEELVVRNETLQALASAVEQLAPIYRTIIALRYDAEMSYQEIAHALDLPINTVRTHLHRAKARLRKTLEEQNP